MKTKSKPTSLKPVHHSMMRLKRWMGFDFKFKKISIKQAFFIDEIFSSRVKVSKQKKNEVFFLLVFLLFLLVLALFSKFEIFKTF
jgi:hypothetical protein